MPARPAKNARSDAPHDADLLASPQVALDAAARARLGAVSGWGARLVDDLGAGCAASDSAASEREIAVRADTDWARSGAMALTGRADGPPVLAPAAFATACEGALQALAALCPSDAGRRALGSCDAPGLLGERAAAMRSTRNGDISVGGNSRIVPTRDGALAVALARDEDIELLEAWFETSRADTPPWEFVARAAAGRSTRECLERARLLGLACSDANPERTHADAAAWLHVDPVRANGPAGDPTAPRAPLVVDLSALWAGPLAGHLLGLAGADVVKVESTRRPDGARNGPVAFFDTLNGGKRSVALDFAAPEGIASLRALLHAADIVIEASRPRALAQLGIDAREIVASRPGRTWLSITGYGREAPYGDWIAFGDDAAVAAGTSAALRAREGEWLFCSDALADPLTGCHAALAAMASHCAGGGNLVALSLRGVTACVLDRAPVPPRARVTRTRDGEYEIDTEGGETVPVRAPRLRSPQRRAATLGADTNTVLAVLESIA